MATTEKPHSKRSRGAGSQDICSVCSNGPRKTEPASRLLRHLLSADVSPGYDSGNQIDVAITEDFSRGLVSSATGPTYTTGKSDPPACTCKNEEAGTQTQEE